MLKFLFPVYTTQITQYVERSSFQVDFRLRNPSSPDLVFVMKAWISILDSPSKIKRNTHFVVAHDFVEC